MGLNTRSSGKRPENHELVDVIVALRAARDTKRAFELLQCMFSDDADELHDDKLHADNELLTGGDADGDEGKQSIEREEEGKQGTTNSEDTVVTGGDGGGNLAPAIDLQGIAPMVAKARSQNRNKRNV